MNVSTVMFQQIYGSTHSASHRLGKAGLWEAKLEAMHSRVLGCGRHCGACWGTTTVQRGEVGLGNSQLLEHLLIKLRF